MKNKENLELLAEKICPVDAVLMGVVPGFPVQQAIITTIGCLIWKDSCRISKRRMVFNLRFQDFIYYCYSSPEQQWAFYARYIQSLWDAPTGQTYYDLAEIVSGKEVFVLTTNVDMQFERVFPPNSICSYQGNVGYFQCSQPCHDRIYPNENIIREMCESMQEMRIPSELLPRCRECGRIMVPWVRDDTFLEGQDWKDGVIHYESFLKQCLTKENAKSVLLLELGVGEMTPGIIKLPFWEMAYKNEGAFYVCMNQEDSSSPEHLKNKSLYIDGDLSKTLRDLKQIMKGKAGTGK